ncbi:MAG: nucleotidyltransferase family protein [Pseudomonadota bacterium]|nr:nucleotidyltransferase family protein [Pseudomonadota bacterium]
MSKLVPKKAMVLAAGLGSRMQPLTKTIPKPMITLGEKPLIDHVLDRLESAGIIEVVVNTHYLAKKLETHLEKRKTPKIQISREEKLLDTGGGVNNVLKHLKDGPFYVINSDAFWLDGPFDTIVRMAETWEDDKMDGLLLLHSTVEAYGYDGIGDFLTNSNGCLNRPLEGHVSPWLFTGIQLLHPRLFKNAPNGAFSLNYLYDKSIETERLYGTIHDGEWFHVGSPKGIEDAENYLQQRYAGNRPGTRHRS